MNRLDQFCVSRQIGIIFKMKLGRWMMNAGWIINPRGFHYNQPDPAFGERLIEPDNPVAHFPIFADKRGAGTGLDKPVS